MYRTRKPGSTLPIWWGRPISPGGGVYGPPLTWGGLLGPLLLVTTFFVVWGAPWLLGPPLLVGFLAYLRWLVREWTALAEFERRCAWRKAHPEVTDRTVGTHAPWYTGERGWKQQQEQGG
jgi:hypothetical protein